MSLPRLLRLPDWRLRLDAFIWERRRQPFAWGINDCCLFAADAVAAITGVDLAVGLRGRGARAALRYIQRNGGLCHVVPDCLPLLPATGAAQDGDVVLIEQRSKGIGGLALGVLDGVWVLGPGRSGLMALPARQAIQAWGVGHA